jgi:hypothetical protein
MVFPGVEMYGEHGRDRSRECTQPRIKRISANGTQETALVFDSRPFFTQQFTTRLRLNWAGYKFTGEK